MSAFFFLNQDTMIHKLDPRVKIAGLIFFCILSLMAKSINGMEIILTLLLLLFLFARCGINLKKMAGLFIFISIMTFILWMLFYRGTDKTYSYGHFTIHAGAYKYATIMSLRFMNLLLAGLLFVSITSVEDFYGGLLMLGVPYRFAFTVSLSFRLVMVFMSNAYNIVEAQKIRGNDVTKGWIIKRIKAYAPLIVPFILNGIKKAETLILALESKGFSPANKIDISGKYAFAPSDRFLLWMIFFVIIGFVYYKFFH